MSDNTLNGKAKFPWRNFFAHGMDGAFFMAAMVFIDQYTIMTAFMKNIINNPFLISLMPAAAVIGFNVPSVFFLPLIQKFKYRKTACLIFGFFQRIMILVLGLFLAILLDFPPLSAGLITVILYFLFASVGGTVGPAWIDLVAKTVPANHRSKLIGFRNSMGALTGIALPPLIAYLLLTYDFPGNYQILFFIAFGLFILSFISLLFVKEELLVSNQGKSKGLKMYLAKMKAVFLEDKNFQRFLAGRILFSYAAVAMSFFTVFYLLNHENSSDEVVAYFTLVMNISKFIVSLIFGYLGDKYSNKLVLIIGTAALLLSNLWSLFFLDLPLYYFVFVFMGIALTADLNTAQVMIAEFGTSESRIYYTAIGNSITGLMIGLFPILTGALLSVNLIDYNFIFISGSVAAILAVCVFTKLKRNKAFA